MSTVSWIAVLVSCFLLCGCKTEELQITVRVEFIDGEVVYSSGGIKSSRLVDLFNGERRPDTLEIILATKLTQSQRRDLREEISLLGIPALRFSEQTSGLRADMKGPETISRSELAAEIENRSN